MSRYINAEPWEDMGASVTFEYPNKCGNTRKGHIMMRDIHTEDVAPVVHGRWENGNLICPVCGEDKFKDLDADIWCDWLPPFCPNCGAKMDGAE